MTESEAIEVLNMIETHGALPTMAKAKSIEALEKQIPKKPIEIDTYGEYYKCPICNKYIVDNFGCGYKFCRECGQAIDWSEEV